MLSLDERRTNDLYFTDSSFRGLFRLRSSTPSSRSFGFRYEQTISTHRPIVSGILPLTILYTDISLLRTSLRTKYPYSLTRRFGDPSFYDLLRCHLATSEFAPRNLLDDRTHVSTLLSLHLELTSYSEESRRLEDILIKSSEKVGQIQ